MQYAARMKETVFVGLSGGVDSAVSAALLKRAGYRVVGAFIKIWRPEFTECTWAADRLDAMRVCAALEIPFREIDLSDAYRSEVVDDMLRAYESGITPNPDVLCNRAIKFGHFAQWALAQGADKIATGHYAQIVTGDDGMPRLHRGADPEKDQSYFLYRLTAEDLARTLFPVGGMKKSEVRVLAKQFDLPVATKHDSQGLCFIGAVSMKEFLSRFITLERGDVIDQEGNVIGTHDGAALYTLGERHGFSAAGGVPLYVTNTDVRTNVVRVSPAKGDAAASHVSLAAPRWIGDEPSLPCAVQAQARYREEPFEAIISHGTHGRLAAELSEPRIASPGQSFVMYDGPRCLGGAFIHMSEAQEQNQKV